jgi:hypothetical protein
VPGIVCADARLTDRQRSGFFSRSISSSDQLYGQAGWHIGVNFLNLADLASRLSNIEMPEYLEARVGGGCSSPRGRRLRNGELTRLAIHAHGVSGSLFINGRGKTPLAPNTLEQFSGQLKTIGLLTPNDKNDPAVILLVGCLAGSGSAGTALLTGLSRKWPNRKVVGFATLGFAPGGAMARGGRCSEPGMRDTTALFPGEADATAGQHWGNLQTWPWASENSPRAKVAFNGAIVRGDQW